MNHALEREPASSAAASGDSGARLVLMTADGGSIDITDAAGDLLVLARSNIQTSTERAPNRERPACPPSLAMLCKHLGRCGSAKACASASPAPAPNAPGKLTGRESQVVAHVRQGFSNKEIARRLGIQEDTVKKHLQAVFGKLGVRRRALVALGHASTA